MNTINIEDFKEKFVIHFGTDGTQINAYTLASTIVSVANAVKEANLLINPGYDVEVVVESLDPGSFKVTVKTIYRGLGNLFDKDNLKAIALSVIAAYIFQHTLAPDASVNISVGDKEVVIEANGKTVIVPREVHDCLNQVEKSEKFKQNIGKTFKAVEDDEKIESVGITPKVEDKEPQIIVPRNQFQHFSYEIEIEENSRYITEFADLTILKAILDRSRRKWEFVWHGIKISAPILDSKFYDEFFAHKIVIAPGDILAVNIKIYQKKDTDTGIFTNRRYEVIEVLGHKPILKQSEIVVWFIQYNLVPVRRKWLLVLFLLQQLLNPLRDPCEFAADICVWPCVAGDFPGEFGGLGGKIFGFTSHFAVLFIEAGQ